MPETQENTDPLADLRGGAHPDFRFVVEVAGATHGVFTECTPPTVEWEMEPVKEGGLNTYVHQLPGRQKQASITLKNGVGTNSLLDWYMDTMNQQFTRHQVTIKLLDMKEKQPVMRVEIAGALPVKWTGPQLTPGGNSIAIQTLELACGKIEFKRDDTQDTERN